MRHFFTILLFLLFWQARPAAAQNEVGIERMSVPADRYLTTIRFRMLIGGIILGKVQLDDFPDSLTFIFDTGCGGVSLDSSTAQRFKLAPRLSENVIRGIAGIRQQRLLEGMRLRVGNINIDSLTMHVCNYEMLSSIYGEQIDGIIGYTFFSRYLVKINYDSLRMDVYTSGPVKYPKGGFLLKPRVFGLPMMSGQLNDARYINSRFFFDTGAGLCLLFSSHFTTDSAVFAPKKKKPVLAEGAGLGGKTEMQLTTLKNFSIGPFKFRQIPTYIFDDTCDITAYPQLGGLIGNDLLRRFNLIVNYPRSEIYLLPNAMFNQPFDYSYSGVSIGLIEGKIVVTDVMKDSPAEKAGFREGDVIVGINGDFRQDVQIYQGLLRTIGPRVKVVVRRNEGEVAQLSLKVKSIL
jgi:PDZ domain/Aspartyl protease